MFEILESRRLFAILGPVNPTPPVYTDTSWTVNRGAADDRVSVYMHGNRLIVNWGSGYVSRDISTFSSLRMNSGPGNDEVICAATLPVKVILSGGDGNDTLIGGAMADRLYGEAGNDVLLGRGGNDQIVGGAGDDVAGGDGGNDTVRGESGHDLLVGNAGNDQVFGGDGNDYLNGDAGNDVLYGDAGNDSMYGGSGNDRFYGGYGNDKLVGDAGRDTLHGGYGADAFYAEDGEQDSLWPDASDVVMTRDTFDLVS
jgi:Ca2+-binding RTX toxin-like protein